MQAATRLAIFATHPIQYQVPLWRKLAEAPDLDVHVYYGTDMSVRGYRDREFGVEVAWDTPLLEGYDHSVLSLDPAIKRIGLTKPNSRGLGALLTNFSPDIGLMTAYWNAFHLGSWRALRKRKTPILIRHEASDVAHTRTGYKAQLRDALLRQLYNRIDGFCYIGTEAKRHLERLGVDASRLWHAPYCVDSDFVDQQISKWRPERYSLRSELGITDQDVVMVFSGKLIPKKDPLLIVEALTILSAQSAKGKEIMDRIHVVVAGDGELRQPLAEGLLSLLGNRVHLLGFLNQGEMGRAYAVGDILCLPSRRGSGETWGLVANEALQWGLPTLLSDGVGSSVDLIDAGETGWCFSSGSSEELAACIKRYAKLQPEARCQMAEAARMKAQTHSSDVARDGIIAACKALVPQKDQ